MLQLPLKFSTSCARLVQAVGGVVVLPPDGNDDLRETLLLPNTAAPPEIAMSVPLQGTSIDLGDVEFAAEA